MKRIIRSLFKNDYIFSIFARLSSFAISMLYSILYSRYMQPELRGRASVIYNYSSLLMLFLCLGINQGYPYFKQKNSKDAFMEYINTVYAFFLLYCLGGIVFVGIFRSNIDLCVIAVLIPLLFLIKELNYVVMIEEPRRRNKASMMISLFDVLLILFFFLFLKPSFAICILFILLAEFVHCVVAIAQTRVSLLSVRPTFSSALKYITYGFFPMLAYVLMEINYKADVLMLDAYGVSKASIGVYTLGVSIAEKIWLIPDAMKDMMISRLAKGQDESEVQKVNRFSLAIVITLCVAFLIIGAPVINILYGSNYSGAYQAISILLIGIVGMIFYKNVYSYNVTRGKRVINLILLGIASLTNILANLALIPKYGIYGAAMSSSVSYLVCGIAFLVYFCRTTGTPYSRMIVLRKDDVARLLETLRPQDRRPADEPRA